MTALDGWLVREMDERRVVAVAMEREADGWYCVGLYAPDGSVVEGRAPQLGLAMERAIYGAKVMGGWDGDQ